MRLRLYIGTATDYLRRAELRELARKAANLVYSDRPGILISKDMAGMPVAPEGNRQPGIRPASMADVLALVGADRAEEADAEDLRQRRLRRHIAATIGVGGCYIAEVDGFGPAFMQYLFAAGDNERLQAAFPGMFPILAADETMVEFLYVAPGSRSPGLAVNGILQVADEARRRGAASVISFIDPSNKGALFVNHLAGFRARSVRRSRRRFFRKTYLFEQWPPGISDSLMDVASGRAKIS